MFATLLRVCLSALAAWWLVGCSQGFYKKWADKQVFGILSEKSVALGNDDGEVLQSITPPAAPSLSELEQQQGASDFLGKRAFIEENARVLSLAKALDFALHHNRTYLGRKERVYLSALSLTAVRQRFGPIADGGAFAQADHTRQLASVNETIRSTSLTSRGNLGVGVLLKTGAQLAVDLTEGFSRWVVGEGRSPWSPTVVVSASQPLLAGAGVLAAAEPLRQTERLVLYEVRDFAQYRKNFVVDVLRQSMRLMLLREQARNRYTAYQSSLAALEREKALAAANLRSQSQLKQIEQGSLSYHRSWLAAVRSYEDALDDLKIQLGLPVRERFIIDPAELKRLAVIDGRVDLDALVEVGLNSRTDLHNALDRLADTQRKVKIFKQATLPGLSIGGTYSVQGNERRNGADAWPSNPDRRLSGIVDLDLNLNQLPERNDLRSAQIAEQAAARAWDLAQEELRGDLRADFRGLIVARQQHDLAMQGLQLAQGRLEIEEALMAEGQGTARDIVESQDRLIVARDLLISTMIDHNIARLQMWSDAGVLELGKDPDWERVLKQEKP